jgi:hypothetical protein
VGDFSSDPGDVFARGWAMLPTARSGPHKGSQHTGGPVVEALRHGARGPGRRGDRTLIVLLYAGWLVQLSQLLTSERNTYCRMPSLR